MKFTEYVIKLLNIAQGCCIILIGTSPIVITIIALFTTYNIMDYVRLTFGLVALSIGLKYTAKIIDELD